MSSPNIQVSINLGGTQVIGTESQPYVKFPGYDLSDDFYRKNGINPDKIVERLVGQDGDPRPSIPYTSPNRDYANVRILATGGAFNHLGNLFYFTVPGKLRPDTFTNDAAGKKAIALANDYRVFVFPKNQEHGGKPLHPAESNRRQDNVFDTSHEYRKRNGKLGLWYLTFVSYTDKAESDDACHKALEDLKKKNGEDLDGTPVITTLKEINHLVDLGCVELRHRKSDGSQGFLWVI